MSVRNSARSHSAVSGFTRSVSDQFYDCVQSLRETFGPALQHVASWPNTDSGVRSRESRAYTGSVWTRYRSRSLPSRFSYTKKERKEAIQSKHDLYFASRGPGRRHGRTGDTFISNSNSGNGRTFLERLMGATTTCDAVSKPDASVLQAHETNKRPSSMISPNTTDIQIEHILAQRSSSRRVQIDNGHTRQISNASQDELACDLLQQKNVVFDSKRENLNKKRKRLSTPQMPQRIANVVIEREDYSMNGLTPELLRKLNKRQRSYMPPIQQRNDIMQFRQMEAERNASRSEWNNSGGHDTTTHDGLQSPRKNTTETNIRDSICLASTTKVPIALESSCTSLPLDSSPCFEFTVKYTEEAKTIEVSAITVHNVKGSLYAKIYLSHGWNGNAVGKKTVKCVKTGTEETSKYRCRFTGFSLNKAFDMIIRVKFGRHPLLPRGRAKGEAVLKLDGVDLGSAYTVTGLLNGELVTLPF